MFTLKEISLHRLCEINNFKIPENSMIFFGLRGCIPVNDENQFFAEEHDLYLININNINPRCTIIQWQPKEKSFSVFPIILICLLGVLLSGCNQINQKIIV